MTKLDDDVAVVERVPGLVWDLRFKDETLPHETAQKPGLFSRIFGMFKSNQTELR